MANFSNKVYSNTGKSGKKKDLSGYYYHKTQAQQQDNLIKLWLKEKNKKIKIQKTV